MEAANGGELLGLNEIRSCRYGQYRRPPGWFHNCSPLLEARCLYMCVWITMTIMSVNVNILEFCMLMSNPLSYYIC